MGRALNQLQTGISSKGISHLNKETNIPVFSEAWSFPWNILIDNY